MATWTAFTTLPNRASAEALGEALEALPPEPEGVGVFEIEDGSGRWEVGGYFTEAPDETVLALLAAAHSANPFAVSELPETDWVAHVRRELRPVEAGRFFVHGSHDAEKVPEGRVGLLIDAAMAFGTGHHGTTLGCLKAIDLMASEGFEPATVADIGCGTAVLAMAAAIAWPESTVIASDIDAQAVEVAEANLRINGLSERVDCVEAEGFAHPDLESTGPFDLILANILMGPLIDLAPTMAENCRSDGRAVLSGILVQQADAVISAYESNGFRLERRDDIGEWTTLVLRRS
ncbi:50S ribosomal protein L11 methyltransferase [Ostreiculturibacter nitratireducens]|uniref:50S ribosomal protein L11 methyltransferase n=1 Tax=Ostreiculturibacter nitratireducens TaxID=3075226 RepID=UPI0031B56832